LAIHFGQTDIKSSVGTEVEDDL